MMEAGVAEAKQWWVNRPRDAAGRFVPGPRTTAQGGRAVAQSLVEMRPCEGCGRPGLDRHHIDGDPLNNSPENIVVLCRRCHMEQDGRLERAAERLRSADLRGTRNPFSKLTEEQVAEIRQKYVPRVNTCEMLAEEYGVSSSTIGAVVRGQNWSWLGERG